MWFTGYINGNNGPCCGDDGDLDNFYNGTINNTHNFCQEGNYYIQEIDSSQEICSQYGYVWINTGFIKPLIFNTTFNLSQGLVSYWNFDEVSGSILHDSMGLNNGTLVGNTAFSSEGKFGGAAFFDGSGDYITIPSSNSLNSFASTGEISISAWVKQTSGWFGGDRHDAVFCKYRTDYWEDSGFDYMLGYNVSVMLARGSSSLGGYGSITLMDGQWHHIITTSNTTTLNLYVDGILDKTFNGTWVPTANNYPAIIGYRYGIHYFRGYIDELRFYNRTLSAEEVLVLFGSYEYMNCCGDDGDLDNFANGTHSCCNGIFTEGTCI